MSMTSAQCAELRSMAASVGLEVPQAATLMMGAADTIDCLDAENAKLRHDLEEANNQAEEVCIENAKLRELCVKALEWLRWAGGITCPPEVPDEFADELRELGVEVDK